jgi:2-dehydropantoate 2-reductase
MRILIVGAGAVGGYFGGRLLEANRDVTFLVRPRRAAELAESGLQIRSRLGDLNFPQPPTVVKENLAEPFDVVVLSCKAYDLEDAMASFAPAVGATTAILPLLNGMLHLQILGERFGWDRVLGGQCVIASTLNERREIVHLNDAQSLSFGEIDGTISSRVNAIADVMKDARFEARASANILAEMWQKWVFLATLAGGTCLMRASIGEICSSPGGSEVLLRLLEECDSIAAAAGFPSSQTFVERTRAMLRAKDSPLTASMLRDIEKSAPIEADHIIGDLLRRAPSQGGLSVLHIVYAHLKAYEAHRAASLR